MLTEWVQIAIMLLIPIFGVLGMWLNYSLSFLRRELIDTCIDLIRENITGLDSITDNNREEITRIKRELDYREEIYSLKLRNINERISYMESYLERTNGFRRRIAPQNQEPE